MGVPASTPPASLRLLRSVRVNSFVVHSTVHFVNYLPAHLALGSDTLPSRLASPPGL
jgi:hypothetical protein